MDGSRSPFDQLPAIADAVGGKLGIILITSGDAIGPISLRTYKVILVCNQ